MTKHWSDCAVHSEPAYPAGECDCGGFKQYQDEGMCQACEFGQCTAKAGCVAISNPPPKQEQGEPWGACVSGRVFVGALPEHVRKLSEDEGFPIQWLYTTPQQRTWVGLTDEEIDKAWRSVDYTVPWEQHRIDIAQAIEAKLKEKNT
jgi:hypothetical protein